MILLACVEAVAIVATAFLCLRHISRLEDAWSDERRELLTRIQHPEIVPVKAADDYKIPEQIPDEWNLVGEITHDPDYGLND